MFFGRQRDTGEQHRLEVTQRICLQTGGGGRRRAERGGVTEPEERRKAGGRAAAPGAAAEPWAVRVIPAAPIPLRGVPVLRWRPSRGAASPSFMLNMSLVMISENVKLAREYALLGNYDSAMVYYQGVLDQMNKYLYSLRDTYLQQKWQQVWQEISVEAKHVKDIMKMLESFKIDSTPPKASQQELPAHDAEVWSLPVPAERRPSPGPRKRQSAQYSDCRGHNNRISAAVRGPHRPSSRNPNDKGKAVRGREKKDQQNKGKEEKSKSTSEISESEPKKFDSTGYDKDLVEALERDIISQNPNIRCL